MGYVLHGSAKTTRRIRKEIHDSRESIATLAARYVFDPQTQGAKFAKELAVFLRDPLLEFAGLNNLQNSQNYSKW
jgi:hypothetical protein